MAKARIGYLDLFRFLTVSFAIASHFIAHTDLFGESYEGAALVGKALTRTATPTLLILFGMMVELVYVSKFRRDFNQAMGALLYRAFLCYLAFIVLAALGWIAVRGSPLVLAAAVPLLAPALYANIFKLYMFVLLTVPLLVVLRNKGGVPALMALGAAILFTHSLVLSPMSIWPQPFHHIGGLLFGIGGEWGPSVLHCIVLVIFGMLLGNVLVSEKKLPMSSFAVAAIVAVSALSLIWNISVAGISDTALSIADINQWRENNDVRYLAFGILASVIILLMSWALDRVLPAKFSQPLRQVGSATLFYFFIANAFLLFFPTNVPGKPVLLVFVVLGYVAIMAFITYLWATKGRSLTQVTSINDNGPKVASAWWQKLFGAGFMAPKART